MKKRILTNGLIVYYYPIEGAYSTALGLYINTGSRNESFEQSGITHLLEHLHFRKLKDLSQKELYCEMDKIGATLKGSTHKELLRFYIKFRPYHFNKAMKLISNAISMNEWTTEDFEAERRVVLNEIYDKENHSNIESIIDSFVWNNHPLSMPILGTVETLNALTLENICEYKNNVFSKENIAVVVTGNISNEMEIQCESYLNNLVIPEKSLCIQHTEKIIKNKEIPNIKLINCNWGLVDVDLSFEVRGIADQYELTLLNSMLGGGATSKLQYVLREEMCLTYDIYSYLEIYSDVSAVHISFSTRKNNIYNSIRMLISVLNSMKSDIAEIDMKTNLPYYSDNLWYWLENPETLNLEIGWDLFKGSEPLILEKRIELYEKVTRERLMCIANDIFKPNNASIVVMGSVQQITQKGLRQVLETLV